MIRISSCIFGFSLVVLLVALVAKTWNSANKPPRQRTSQQTNLTAPPIKHLASPEPLRPDFEPPAQDRKRSECDPTFIAQLPNNIRPQAEKACAGLTVARTNQAAAQQQELAADANLRGAKAKKQSLQIGVLDAEDDLVLQARLFEAQMASEDASRAYSGQMSGYLRALGEDSELHKPDPNVFISGQSELMKKRLGLSKQQRAFDFKLREANAEVESAQSRYEAAKASRRAADAQVDVAQAELERLFSSY